MDAWSAYWQPGEESDFVPVEAQLSTFAPDSAPYAGHGDGDGRSQGHAPVLPAAKKARAARRIEVGFGAALRQRGASGVSVQIMDLSTHGFRVATHLELARGTDVWLRLPGLEPYHATVAWSQGHFVGCEFERPLHPAVLDMLVRKAAR